MARRSPPELEEVRAKRVAKLLLMGLEGVMLSRPHEIDADFRSTVRTATFATRRALDGGTTAYEALRDNLLPVFASTPRARIKHTWGDE